MSLTAKQIILFGSPGTGKSRHIVKELLPELGINPQGPDCKRVVFHPEYAYGDFMGKLMPLSEGDKVQYWSWSYPALVDSQRLAAASRSWCSFS